MEWDREQGSAHRFFAFWFWMLFGFLACALASAQPAIVPAPQPPPAQQPAPQLLSPDQPTLRVTSTLVFLDVTVLDKKDRPVTSGLTREDFTITEDKKPQRIFSFEAPQEHILGKDVVEENPEGKAPITILVLDLLNSRFEDFAYIRWSVRSFLMAQPEQLASPAELLVVGNNSLEMLQGFTRSRADLLYALDHLPAALPFKRENAAFFWERFAQSFDGLQQIALQNKGIPGRKNIVWVGHGGPSVILNTANVPYTAVDELKRYTHSTVNMLVDARMSLFVIYPGLPVGRSDMSYSAAMSTVQIGDNDPFTGDISFGLLVNETGGKLFYNRNDVDAEIAKSEQMGSQYYTLTYQPQGDPPDGKFRRIRVTLRDPNLHAVTKAGYYAPDAHAPVDERHERMVDIAEAVQSPIAFNALDLELSGVVRHPDTQTADVTVKLLSKNFTLQPLDAGGSTAHLILGAASLDRNRRILASKVESVRLSSPFAYPHDLPAVVTHIPIALRVPRKTASLRIVIENADSGRMGAVDLDRKAVDAAPAASTPEPVLTPARPASKP